MASQDYQFMDDLRRKMLDTIRNGYLQVLRQILLRSQLDDEQRKTLLNSLDYYGRTVLQIAATSNKAEIVKWLLSDEGRAAGFDSVLAKTKDGRTALHIAAENGYAECCKAIVNGCREDNGERREMLNAVINTKETVLHLAARRGQMAKIKWLLSDEEGGGRAAGLNILATAQDGSTVLHYAAQHERLDVCKAIVDACRVDNGERQEMLNAISDDGRTVLHHAAQIGNTDLIGWILTEGVDAGFDRKNITALTKGDSFSALHIAVRRDIMAIQALLSHCNDQERMNLFLCVDNKGWTALHHAARKEPKYILELLQYSQCSLIVNRKDKLGMTVLHRAIIRGLDDESRKDWNFFGFGSYIFTVQALLGCLSSSSTTVAPIVMTTMDPNIGLGL